MKLCIDYLPLKTVCSAVFAKTSVYSYTRPTYATDNVEENQYYIKIYIYITVFC